MTETDLTFETTDLATLTDGRRERQPFAAGDPERGDGDRVAHAHISAALGVSLDEPAGADAPRRLVPNDIQPPTEFRRVEAPRVEPEQTLAQAVAPDADVTKALNAVELAADRVNELVDRMDDLPGRVRAEEAAYQRAVVEADTAGRPLPKPRKRIDVDAERAELSALYAGRLQVFRQAKATLEAAVAAALPKWADVLTADIPRAHAAAVAAVAPDTTATVHEAAAALQAWQYAIQAAESAQYNAGRRVDPVRREAGCPQPEALQRGLDEAIRALSHSDPALTGEYLTWPDEGIEPSRYMRRKMFESGAGSLLELQMIEERERYSVSSWTRDMHRQR